MVFQKEDAFAARAFEWNESLVVLDGGKMMKETEIEEYEAGECGMKEGKVEKREEMKL